MRRYTANILVIIMLLVTGFHSEAQLIRKAGELLQSAINEVRNDSVPVQWAGNADSEARAEQDTARFQEMMLQIQELKLNEMLLRSELATALNQGQTADSLKEAAQRRSIDSLRAVTPGVPVVAEGDTLFFLFAERGGYSALDRAEMTNDMLLRIAKEKRQRSDSVYILENENYIDIMYGSKVLLSITDKDAMWQGTTRRELAESYAPVLASEIDKLREGHSFMEIVKRVLLFVLVIVAQYFLFKLTNYLFRKLRRKNIRFTHNRLKPIYIHEYELLNTRRLARIMLFFNNLLRYFVLLLQLMFSVPIMFAIFPQTEKLAFEILLYIIEPIRMVLGAVVAYIPNLFIIIVIWLCIRYIIKGLRFIANEIENEKLKITGFYPDWARPSFNIIRFLLYAFMIAMIYPYLPGSDSGVFQGISVFVGLIVSLGSSTIIGNIIAGLVITYMRPYRIGDRIKLNDTVGNVIEKTPFVTRLRTPKNEVVTIPNSFIMSSHTVNYSASARQFGLIIHTSVTIGYDVPWRQVHQLLINAARLTPGVLEQPKPFVLETELSDYYPCYQINAYIKDADNQGPIMSDLLQNIQDVFAEAGIEIMSPQYIAARDGNPSTLPPTE